MLSGVAASRGYGMGKAIIIKQRSLDYGDVVFGGVTKEKARFTEAAAEFISYTSALAADVKKNLGSDESEIIGAHIAMMKDPVMLARIDNNIETGMSAEEAVDKACASFIGLFKNAEAEFTKQKALDIVDIRNSLLSILLGVNSFEKMNIPADSVIVTSEFTPSMAGKMNKENISAVVSETGGVMSHSAILMRAMEIPAVFSVSEAFSSISGGDELLVDGVSGKISVNPTAQAVTRFLNKEKEFEHEKASLKVFLGKPTLTADGVKKHLFCNISDACEVESAVNSSAEGIGLFRTEYLYMNRSEAPDEEEQYSVYSAVAKAMADLPVIIRTLDAGGDKSIECLSMPKEENPFLGNRAVRFCLENTALFKVQLRAVLRAGAVGNVKILLPFITTVNEVRQVKRLIKECKRELAAENKNYADVPLGIMIETPSAVAISDLLAREVDFFSIGTNDLTAYIMAADRTESKLNSLCTTTQPAVLRSIEFTLKNAKAAGIKVGVCGEAASDSQLLRKLIEWGTDEFSVAPASVLLTRKLISECKQKID